MLLVLLWLGCAVAASAIASGKGRSGFGWLLLGAILGPLALLGAVIVGRDTERDTRDGLRSGDLRPCPECREPIQREARKCRHCGSAVEPLPPRLAPIERLVYFIADKIEERRGGNRD